MMLNFLNNSSIHGLRYLSKEQNTPSRIFWTISVTISFSLAIVLCYLNLVSWSETPAVVQSVEVINIQDNIHHPVIVICPEQPFLKNFIGQFFNDPDVLKDPGVQRARHEYDLFLMSEDLERATRFRYFSLPENQDFEIVTKFKETFRKFCIDSVPVPETCDLWNTLWRIRSMINSDEYEDFTEVVKSSYSDIEDVYTYTIINSLYYQVPIDIAAMNQEIQNFFPMFQNYSDIFLDPDLISNENFSHLYVEHYLFTNDNVAFSKARSENATLIWLDLREPVKEGNLVINLRNIEHYGTFLLALHLRKDLEKRRFLKFLNDAIKGFLEVDLNSPLTYFEIIQAFDKMAPHFNSMAHCNQENETCSSCKLQVCDTLTRVGKEKNSKIYKLLSAFYPDPDSSVARNPANPVPFCKLSQESGKKPYSCLQKTITDIGFCYTINSPTWNEKGFEETTLISNDNITNTQSLIIDFGDILESSRGLPVEFKGVNDVIIQEQSFNFALYTASANSYTMSPINYKELHLDSLESKKMELPVNVMAYKKTTEAFRNMAVSRRKCLYPDERKLDYHDFYSQASCILECAWTRAVQDCPCVPWYLHQHFPDLALCGVWNMECFEKIISFTEETSLTNGNTGGSCRSQCLPDCENVLYQSDNIVVHSGSKFSCRAIYNDVDDPQNWYCDYKTEVENATFDSLEGNYADSIRYGDRSKYVQNNFVSLNFVFVNDVTSEIVRTATVTIIDMISNIGGTLGLFSGFSILSGIEIFYWLAKLVRQRLPCKRREGVNKMLAKRKFHRRLSI